MTGRSTPAAVVIDPARFDAVVFDMDGVVTDTAGTHQAAWAHLFDEYLATRPPDADRGPFTSEDYRTHVDGRARVDGVASFLAARGIALPPGAPEDPPDAPTVWGLANRKNRYFLAALAQDPPEAFPSTIELIDALRAAGVKTAVVTASANRAEVLAAAGVGNRFQSHVDGRDAADLDLAGKPAPDLFLEAARRLGVNPAGAVVIEDATAGVTAARRAGVGLIIGVARAGYPERLAAAGADIVVTDLAEVAVAPPDPTTRSAEPGSGASPPDPAWIFGYRGFEPDDEGRREALCALGNGVFATRASAPESGSGPAHYPGTYAAGFYNRLVSERQGRSEEHESMVNLPDWLSLSIRPADQDWLDLSCMHLDGYDQHLDLRRGMLHRNLTFTDTQGRTTRIEERRLVHMVFPQLGALEWTITPLNWSGPLEIRSGIDSTVENRNVAAEHDLASHHLTDIGTGNDGAHTVWVDARTSQSQRHLTIAARTRVRVEGIGLDTPSRFLEHPGRIDQHVQLAASAGVIVTVDKVAAVVTSREPAIADTHHAALGRLADAGSMDDLAASHSDEWDRLWRCAHLDLRCDDPIVARTLNLHTFHVLQTLSPHIADRDVGVPARGLTGEGYRGHVFWDELFVFPYLNLRFPALTRELLRYRHRRLPAARRQAAALGCRGARYPWQSGSDGREETPTEFFNPRSRRWMPDHSRRQHHVSLAIAYEVWQYHQVTADDAFLADYGAELLVEIARFWVDLAQHDPATDRHHLRGVMGPDEFHDGYPDRPGQGIDDNAYTNVMVSWLLKRACDAHRHLGDRAGELWERLGVTAAELATWDHVSRSLHVPFHGDGIISQFAGYEHLAELDWDTYRDRYANIGRLDLILEAEGDTTNRYKAAKQADVLMLFYLFSAEELTDLLAHLGYDFDPARIPTNVDYYTGRMTHGSTLCRVAMAWVLARTDRTRSWNTFREALASDVADIQGGTTREGIHLGAMAGTIDLVQRCYTGLEARGDALWLNPRLPDELHRLAFGFTYRGQHIDASITADHVELAVSPSVGAPTPITVHVAGVRHELNPHDRVTVPIRPQPR